MLAFITSLSPLTRFTIGAVVALTCVAVVAYAEARRAHIVC